jgi:hypothetical protein
MTGKDIAPAVAVKSITRGRGVMIDAARRHRASEARPEPSEQGVLMQAPDHQHARSEPDDLSHAKAMMRWLLDESIHSRDVVAQMADMPGEIAMSDAPRGLARLATAIGEEGTNIGDGVHDHIPRPHPQGAQLVIVVEIESADHGEALLDASTGRGYAAANGPP